MLEITAAGMRFLARFEEEPAPQTVAAFRAMLPLEDRIIHCRWSGESNWIPWGDRDLGIGPENATSYPHPGRARALPRRPERDRAALPVRLLQLREQGRPAVGEPLRHARRGAGAAEGARPADPLGGCAADLVPRDLGFRHEPVPALARRRSRAADDDPRALLRPRLRVRDHAGLAPRARRSELDGRGSRHACAARRLVGVELHDVGHERARPGLDRRASAAARADVREPAARRRDPGGVRRPRAAVRRRVRRDPGGPAHLPDVRHRGTRDDRARAVGPDPRVALRRRRALAGGRLRRRRGAHGAVARGPGDRLRRAARPLLGARPREARGGHVGGRDGALRRALPALPDHRARRDDRDHRSDDGRPGARHGTRCGARARLPLDRRALVALLRLRRPDRRAAPGARGGAHEAGARRATRTCTS